MSNVTNIKQQRAIDSLLAGQRHNVAAAAAKVTAQTLSRWLRDDVAFVTELSKQRGELTAQIGAQVMAGAGAAFRTLAELCEVSEDESIRLRSAVAILSLATGSIADLERESRFALLQARVETALQQRADPG